MLPSLVHFSNMNKGGKMAKSFTKYVSNLLRCLKDDEFKLLRKSKIDLGLHCS